jgi:hypothetical protein
VEGLEKAFSGEDRDKISERHRELENVDHGISPYLLNYLHADS